MKFHKCDQTKIITAANWGELEQKFNTAMMELCGKNPVREILEPNVWAIFYTEEYYEPDTEDEQRDLEGTELHCIDCEFFRLTLNADGTERMTTKKGRCTLWNCAVYKTGVAKAGCYGKLEKIREGGE